MPLRYVVSEPNFVSATDDPDDLLHRPDFTVLMADDDTDDVSIVSDALAEFDFDCNFRSVSDGCELIQYLEHVGAYVLNSPEPSLILLDLNMPKRNGVEALAELKATPHLRHIPVVILTTSDAERDLYQTSILGADGYLTKPNSQHALVAMTQALRSFHVAQGGHHGA